MTNKVSLNGIEIYPFSSEKELCSYVKEHKGILVAIHAEKIITAPQRLREIINRNIGYCDGAGATKALRRKGYKQTVRIPGCELWLKLIANDSAASFYLIGSTDEVISATVKKLRETYPSLNIVSYRNGFIKNEQEKQALIKEVTEKKPDYVFVAMGSPKQEYLMDELFTAHQAVYQGLGGSFDVYTGYVKRAPEWWIEHNLEGAYRLIKQPSKIKRAIKALTFWWNLYLNKY